MAGLEGIIRPFAGEGVTAKQFFQPGTAGVAPARLSVGLVGGNKTFAWSYSTSLSSYMAAVHTEKTSDAFDMSTGKLAG